MVAAHIWGTEMGVFLWIAFGALALSLALLGYLMVDFIRWHKVLDENDQL